jgi:hypothetical protein
MALFAARVHKGIALARGGLKVLKEKLMEANLMSTDTGVVATYYPNSLVGLTVVAEDFSDGSNDDVTLGQVNVITGNAVEGIIGDIGTATEHRVTAIINRSGGIIYATVVDESNTKINGQGKRLKIAKDGLCVLIETANDLFRIVDAVGVTLVAY